MRIRRNIFRDDGWSFGRTLRLLVTGAAGGAIALALGASLIVRHAIDEDQKITPMEDFNGTAQILPVGKSRSAVESKIHLRDRFGTLLLSEREHPVIKGGFLVTARNLRPGSREELNDTYDKIRVCAAPPAEMNTDRAIIVQRAIGETLDVVFHVPLSHQFCTLSTTRRGTNVTLDCTCYGEQALADFDRQTQIEPEPEPVPEDSPDFIGPQRPPELIEPELSS